MNLIERCEKYVEMLDGIAQGIEEQTLHEIPVAEMRRAIKHLRLLVVSAREWSERARIGNIVASAAHAEGVMMGKRLEGKRIATELRVLAGRINRRNRT